jgi:hypothetical protein
LLTISRISTRPARRKFAPPAPDRGPLSPTPTCFHPETRPHSPDPCRPCPFVCVPARPSRRSRGRHTVRT